MYLRIIEEGDVGAGDEITFDDPPSHGFTLREFGDLDRGASAEELERVANIADVPAAWRDWARRQLARHQA